MYVLAFTTPYGKMALQEEDGVLVRLYLPHGALPPLEERETPLLLEGRRQLGEYFAGTRREFTLPLRAAGTPFRERVWAALGRIPYGETISYGELARRIGNPKAVRAVGQANHHNPLPILIPCHRVVGAGGALTGYAGGLLCKEKLLQLERGQGR